ncbi:hypothetical protein SAMD00019534_087800 [Acytostelium subglobosum LB1]|uniref:hypothetical protein n=1 Tax=Acytostelium subglobosum LB1 TaxID=1410327 RepID=UPI00064513C2|nr:hypothetical protein SAMD00019534_087800 [Acytostelium subglobosum LB1]GAM25605.1 hypothetical protein SAMD00019534_087800 [Acytostelium subglobosum LB1]|eukprot:XP_012751591.1 hypothetical protein SAMD00019534_087800 [Acytostelium subglobosum LB1]
MFVLPVSPHSPNSLAVPMDKMRLTNRYLEWHFGETPVPVESMLVHIEGAKVMARRADHAVDLMLTTQPFSIDIDLQSLDQTYINTVEVLNSDQQPTVVDVRISPLCLDVNEHDFGFVCDIAAQHFRSMDDMPKLKLRRANPYLLDHLLSLAAQSTSQKILDINGMRVNLHIDQLLLQLHGQGASRDPFADVNLHNVDIHVDLPTVARLKQMHVAGAVKQLEVYDRRHQFNHDTSFNERMFYSYQDTSMIDFTYLSFNTKSPMFPRDTQKHSTLMNFNMHNLHTMAYPAFLLRVWDYVVVSFTSGIGGYKLDKYKPVDTVDHAHGRIEGEPDSSSIGRMKMIVNFDHPVIQMLQDYNAVTDRKPYVTARPRSLSLTNDFEKLSDIEALMRQSEYSETMKVTLQDTTLLLHQSNDSEIVCATNYDINIIMESKPLINYGEITSNASNSYALHTNTLRLKVDERQFDAFYRCLNHSIECQYQLDHATQSVFLRPNHKIASTDMFIDLQQQSVIFDLCPLGSDQVHTTLTLNDLKVDTAILFEKGLNVVSTISSLRLDDTLNATASPARVPIMDIPNILSFTYKTHNKRSDDGWDSELECIINGASISSMPFDHLMRVKRVIVDTYNNNPLAQRPTLEVRPAPRMRMSTKIKNKTITLFDPSHMDQDRDQVKITIPLLELSNNSVRQSFADIPVDLEQWTYNISSLSCVLSRGDTSLKLLDGLHMLVRSDTIRDYDDFLRSMEELVLSSSDTSTIPPTSTTDITLPALNLRLSKENCAFLNRIYTSYQRSVATTDVVAPPPRKVETKKGHFDAMSSIVTLHQDSFTVVLTDGKHGLATMAIKNIEATQRVFRVPRPDGSTTSITGQLKSFRLTDNRREMVQSKFKKIVETSSPIHFTFKPDLYSADTLWTQHLELNLHGLTITPLFSLFTDIQSCFKIEDEAALAVVPASSSKLKFDVTLQAAKIILPLNIEQEDCMHADIEELIISNAYLDKQHYITDQTSMRINKFSLVTHIQDAGQLLISSKILADLNLDITNKATKATTVIQDPVQQQSAGTIPVALCTVLDFGNIHFNFTCQEYLFMYNVINATLKRYYEYVHGPYGAPIVLSESDAEHRRNTLPAHIEMNVQCSIQMLKMTMHSQHHPSSELMLKRMIIGADMSQQKMVVSGTAKDLAILCGSGFNSLYNEVLSKVTKSKQFFSFKYISYAPLCQPEGSDWDAEYSVDLSSIDVVSMIGSIMRVKDFVMEPLSTPIVAPPHAPVRGRPSRMKQIVNMEPWTLLIPATDTSHDAVTMSFGTTTLTNFYRFVLAGQDAQQQQLHNVEVLHLDIASLDLFTIREGNRVTISNHATCTVDIERLYTIDNRVIEDQRMLVRIPALELILCEEDYRFLNFVFTSDWMRFSTDQNRRPPIAPPVPRMVGHKLVYVAPEYDDQMHTSENQFSSPVGFIDLAKDDSRQMTMFCDIGHLSMAISHLDAMLDPIASLEIGQVNLNYYMFRNGIVRMEMTVKQVQLVDERHSSDSVFKEILTRKYHANYDAPHLYVESLIDSRKSRNFVTIHCDHPMLFVSPDSILPILAFFSSIQKPTKYHRFLLDQNHSNSPASSSASPPTVPGNFFRLYLKVTKPKMLLVENETQQSTRAIVIKMPIEFHYSRSPEMNQTMEMKAPRCRVFRNTPFTDNEGTSSTPITNKFSFDFILLHFSENDQRTIKITFQPLNIFLSYKEILLINRIVNNLTVKDSNVAANNSSGNLQQQYQQAGGSSTPNSQVGSPVPAPLAADDLFIDPLPLEEPAQEPPSISSTSSDKSKRSNRKRDAPKGPVKGRSLRAPVRPEDSFKLMHKTRAKLDFVGRVNLTLLDELHAVTLQDIPFLQLTMGDLSSDFWGWADYSFLQIKCLLKVEVFNYKHMAFDSLVEQFPLQIHILQSEDPRLKINVRTSDLVNINISHPFISSFARFYENIQVTNEKELKERKSASRKSLHIDAPQNNNNLQQGDPDEGSSSSTSSHDKPQLMSPRSTKPLSIPTSPTHSRTNSMSSIGSVGSLMDLVSPTKTIETVRWKRQEVAPAVIEKPSLSSMIIAHRNRDSMKSSVIASNINTKQHRRLMSSSSNAQQLFNTMSQHVIWIVNLTGKDIMYYVEELQLQQQPSKQDLMRTGSRHNLSASSSTVSLPSIPEDNAGSSSSSGNNSGKTNRKSVSLANRQIHVLKNMEKSPLELNSVLFKTRDFRTLGSLNAHIALKFTDSEQDQWIHGVSINMMGDNFYFIPHGNKTNIIVCEVGWNESNENKIATLRSPVIVKNSCTIPVELLLATEDNEEHHIFGPIAVHENFYVPVEFFNHTSKLSMRPAGTDFDFDLAHALDLVDSASWPSAHLFAPFKENKAVGTSSHHSYTSLQGIFHRFHMATLIQAGIRCEKTGLISTTLVVCPPVIIENALYCDINVRVHSHSERKRNKSDYKRSIEQHPPAMIQAGKQIPFYTHAENDVGVTISLRGLGKEQYFHLHYMLDTTPHVFDKSDDSNFTQEVTYTMLETGYPLVLKIDHRFEGGCHIATIYAANTITNHTMIPFVMRPTVSGPKTVPILILESNENALMLSHDKFTLSHPSFPDINSREFDILLGKEDIIELQLHGHDTMQLQFKVFVSTGNSVYFRTRRVDIYPRFCLVNKIPETIFYTQYSKDVNRMAKERHVLRPDDQTPFHWFNGFDEQQISIKLEEDEWTWSGGVRIDTVGTNYLKLFNSKDRTIERAIKVEVIDSNESTMVVFYAIDHQLLPFHIKNDTQLTISFVQLCPQAKKYILKPGESAHYTWDHPCLDQKLVVWIESSSTPIEINLNKIKAFKPIKYNNQFIFPVSQAVNGITRELTFSHHHEEEKVLDMIEFAIEFSFERLGFSFINDVPEELIYILLKDCSFWYSASNITHTTWITVDDIQVDNQKPDTDYPVMLWCEKKLDGKCLPFLEFSAIKLNKKNFDYYDLIALYMNELYVQIDDITLINLYSFYSKLPLDKFFRSNSKANVEQPSMFYIKWLIFAEIKIYLTFSISRDGILSHYNRLPALRLLVPSLGKSLGQLENAPLTINQLGIKNVFTTHARLQEQLYAHYSKQMRRQVHIILGSSSIFGSPVVLFNTISTGMTEAIEEPIKGSILLMKRILYAVANSYAKLFGTISNGFAVWSMDETYLRRRDAEERIKAKHIGQGIILGTKGLAIGVFEGFTGIITQPVMGAMEDGAIGFMKGVGKGIAGLAIKPFTGMLDFAARTSEGIRNNTNINPEKFRIRVPRYLNPREPIREFVVEECEGNFLLRQNSESIIQQQGVKKLEYKYHLSLPECTVLLTSMSVICLNKKGTYRWSFPLTEISRIGHPKSGKTYLNIHLKRYLRFGTFSSSKKKVSIQCYNEAVLVQLDSKIRSCLFKSYDIDLDAEANEDAAMLTITDKSTNLNK